MPTDDPEQNRNGVLARSWPGREDKKTVGCAWVPPTVFCQKNLPHLRHAARSEGGPVFYWKYQ